MPLAVKRRGEASSVARDLGDLLSSARIPVSFELYFDEPLAFRVEVPPSPEGLAAAVRDYSYTVSSEYAVPWEGDVIPVTLHVEKIVFSEGSAYAVVCIEGSRCTRLPLANVVALALSTDDPRGPEAAEAMLGELAQALESIAEALEGVADKLERGSKAVYMLMGGSRWFRR